MTARGRDSRTKKARKASRKMSTLKTRLAWLNPELDECAADLRVDVEGIAAATTGVVIVVDRYSGGPRAKNEWQR